MSRLQQLWRRLTIGRGEFHPLSRKMLIETLCIAQGRMNAVSYAQQNQKNHVDRLQYLIDLIDEPKRRRS